ncbi:ABC transporter permease [bacterium]|nr:MAG: ABC transporter permease [bacterium]
MPFVGHSQRGALRARHRGDLAATSVRRRNPYRAPVRLRAATGHDPLAGGGTMKRIFGGREFVPALLAVLVFIHGATTSPFFLDFRYLLDKSSLYIEAGLLALAMTLVIVGGQIDLSVASTLALVACVTAKLIDGGCPAPLAIVIGLALGGALGWLNGVLIARLKLPSFMVTLGTMAAYRGVAQVLVGSGSAKVPVNLMGVDMITIPGTSIPLPLVIFVIATIAVGLLLHRTVYGRWLYSVGTNERAAFFAGVPTAKVTTLTFTLAGFIAGFGGLVMSSRLGVARYDHGRGLEVDAITAVVLGGASIAGGNGTIAGTFLALLLVGLLRTDMGIANVTAEYQLAAIGTLLVLSVLVSHLIDRLAARRKGKPLAQSPS